jgi:hypothetical protein
MISTKCGRKSIIFSAPGSLFEGIGSALVQFPAMLKVLHFEDDEKSEFALTLTCSHTKF